MALVGKNHSALSTTAELVKSVDKTLFTLAQRMLITCKKHNGVALAANQVGVPINMVVLSGGEWFINVFLDAELDTPNAMDQESCLSLPGRTFLVPRFDKVSVLAVDMTAGEEREYEVEGFTARMWQHEHDHLMGRLISNYEEIRNASGPSQGSA